MHTPPTFRIVPLTAVLLLMCLLGGCDAGQLSRPSRDAASATSHPDGSVLTDASPPSDADTDAGTAIDAGVNDAGLMDASTGDAGMMDAGPSPLPAPTFPHLDSVVDLFRGETPTWLEFVYVRAPETTPEFFHFDYEDSASAIDFWPASTIKIYTATAALQLIQEYDVSLDAEATFYRRASSSDAWIEDTTRTFREMIFDVFDYSSNPDYTLLLRFAGIDWLNTEFFTTANGFNETALLVGYVSSRPSRYIQSEEQRIVIRDGARTLERTHVWSGRTYDTEVGCSVRYGRLANCSSPRDMNEHMRRLMFHEMLPSSERFNLRESDLEWMQRGDSEPVLNDVTSRWAGGIQRVLPNAGYYHKAGQVSAYALDLHYVDDTESDTHFIASVVTESSNMTAYLNLSEALTRMVLTPHAFLSLDYLVDYVNPVRADLWVYAESPGTLELIYKDYAEDGTDLGGWSVFPGTRTRIESGERSVSVRSDCLPRDARYHVRGRFTPDSGERIAYSDLHYVIVDADVACP